MEESLFDPLRPSPEIAQFFSERPEATWRESLQFLLDRYPQMDDGVLVWIIEGGTAIKLLFPDRSDPHDIDMIVRGPSLKKAFYNARVFDAKTPDEWLQQRGVIPSEEASNLLWQNYQEQSVEGRQVYMASPALLAVSKLLSFRGRPRRAEDESDLELLRTLTADHDISQLIQSFVGQS